MAKRRPAGDGMVRKREDGRWEGRIVIGHKDNGDSIFRYFSAPTQKALTAKLRQNVNAYQGVELTEDSKMTLGQWLDRWLDCRMTGAVRESTLAGYRLDLNHHVKPYLGDKPLLKLTSDDLQALYHHLLEQGRRNPRSGKSPGLSATTVRGIHTTLHHALKTAAAEGLIPSNPAAAVSLPKPEPQPRRILNDRQLDIFRTAVQGDDLWRDFFLTELTTGLRRGELCGLKWEDFDEAAGTLNVCRTIHTQKGGGLSASPTKTRAGTRSILLPPSTAALLAERRNHARSEWIFPNLLQPESPMNPSTAYRRLKEILAKTGLPGIRFHDLRHTFATHALASGVDAKTLSGILGHTKASFTLDTYTHTTTEMHRNAAEIVGGFLTDYLGEELKPWQNAESLAQAASI